MPVDAPSKVVYNVSSFMNFRGTLSKGKTLVNKTFAADNIIKNRDINLVVWIKNSNGNILRR